MEVNLKSDMVILGAGIVGMVTAIALSNRGIKTTVIELRDKKDLLFSKDERNIAITKTTEKWFRLNNIWEDLVPFAAKVNDIYVIDDKDDDSMIHLNQNNPLLQELGHMILNHDLTRIIFEKIQSDKNINLIFNTGYTDIEANDNINLIHLSDSSILESSWVLACDGKFSAVKKKYCHYKVQKNYNQSALIFQLEHEKAHEGTAVEHFTNSGVFAILPTKNQTTSSLVWIEKSETIELLKAMSVEEFLDNASEKFGPFLGKLSLNSSILSYPLTAELIKNYYHKKIIFLGDAAHSIHPLAGQGLNQGIKDVVDLVELISSKHSAGCELLTNDLKLYQRRRSLDNYIMFAACDYTEKIFQNKSDITSIVRKMAMKLVNKSSWLKDKIINFGIK
ncbi:MAG: FAD-dependent monooxygenase [Rickettsiaceae bacterium]|nr:FAD-dependent monooxygenase [Rickettsiaceae bacterium]